jgi:hypothetical protein
VSLRNNTPIQPLALPIGTLLITFHPTTTTLGAASPIAGIEPAFLDLSGRGLPSRALVWWLIHLVLGFFMENTHVNSGTIKVRKRSCGNEIVQLTKEAHKLIIRQGL